jgi:hypothetical protein
VQSAAYLVDSFFPRVPVRQYREKVMSFIIVHQSHLSPFTCMLQPLMADNSNYRYGRQTEYHSILRAAASLQIAAFH